MPRRWVLVALLAAPVAVAVGLQARAIVTRQDTARRFAPVVQQWAERGDFDTTLVPIFQRIATRLHTDLELDADIVVNAPYRQDALNVYILRSAHLAERASEPGIMPLGLKIAERARHNALAIPPNILVIDQHLLASILNNAMQDVNGLFEGLGQGEPLVPDQAAVADTSLDAVFEVMRRALTADALKTRDRISALRATRSRATSDELTPEEAAMLMSEPIAQIGEEVGYFALFPILAHEIGHLRRAVDGAFLGVLPETLDEAAQAMTRREEERADRFAEAALRRALRRTVPPGSSNTESVEGMIATQSLIATAKYLRDAVALEIFEGVRGLRTEDLYTELLHRECEDSVIESRLPFDVAERLVLAQRASLPLFTEAEAEALRPRFHALSARTHAHHLQRADRMARIADEFSHVDAGQFLTAGLRPLLDVYATANIAVLSPDTGLAVTDLRREQLVSALSADIARVEPGAGCVKSRCEVAFLTDDHGFVEIVSDRSGMVRRALVGLWMRPGKGPNAGDWASDARALLLRVVVSTFPSDSAEAQSLAIRKHEELRRCGAASFMAATERRDWELRTAHNGDLLLIEVGAPGIRD